MNGILSPAINYNYHLLPQLTGDPLGKLTPSQQITSTPLLCRFAALYGGILQPIFTPSPMGVAKAFSSIETLWTKSLQR